MPLTYLWLFPLGLAIGAFGTLIGAGGGFILVPILLIVYPNENTELITSISLAVVFFNALSGSVAYARMKRIDYKSGIIFAVATIPGGIDLRSVSASVFCNVTSSLSKAFSRTVETCSASSMRPSNSRCSNPWPVRR